MISLTGVFAFIFVALNLMLHAIVIRPSPAVADRRRGKSRQSRRPGIHEQGQRRDRDSRRIVQPHETSLVQAMKMLGSEGRHNGPGD